MTKITYPFPEPPAAGAAIEVAPRILWLRLPLPMALDHVNLYALEDEEGWTLVDTGMATPEAKRQWESLLAGPLQGKPVRRVIVTHHHPDHIGMAGWFMERGAELFIHRTAYLYARMLLLDLQERVPEAQLAFWRRAGMEEAEYERRRLGRPYNAGDTCAHLPLGFTSLREGQLLTMGGRDWEVRFGHGHAPWHATLWSGDVVLGGDQFLPSISSNVGVYAMEPEADPLGEWLESCERFAAFARREALILPGHKLPYRGLPLRLKQLSGNHMAALDRLRDFLAEPRSAVDCFPLLFKRAIASSQYTLALGEALAHLNHLWHRGELRRELSEDGRYLWQRL